MLRKRLGPVVALWMLAAASPATAQDNKKVIDEILDILRQNNQISPEQYQDLKKKAEAEQLEAVRKQADEAKPEPGVVDLRASWKEGFRVSTPDGAFELKVGAEIQNDWAVTLQDQGTREAFDLTSVDTGTEFRRARLLMSGVVYRNFPFRFQYDFAEGAFKDVYIGARDLPVVQFIRIGHFKEPFSLEELTSNIDLTFMERGLPNAFAPKRNSGLGALATELDRRLTWAAGVFHEADDLGEGFGPNNYNLTARVTGLPWYESKGTRLVHLGFAYSHQFRDDFEFGYNQRPEAHLYPVPLVNTGAIPINGVDLIGAEAAMVVGPFSMQFEYENAFVNQTGPDLSFGGWYVFASYFLTDDFRPYDTGQGVFTRVKPQRDMVFDGEGWGAWELAARFSRLDLNSGDIEGGVLDDVTAGVNWYLNPVLRVEANYVWANLESVGDSNIFESRFQLVF